ncbi:MAG: GNAT family N-acetyltransferase [Clostridium sp.]|uniref:GNAT family N-acetyltransferase n=1 Tax=Clostridium sp. TaxID=1506 RepID=UPI003F38FF6F
MKIKLKRVCKENYKEILDLHIGEGQQGFIETTEECLKEAKERSLWRPVGIYNDDVLIGFAMYGLFKEEGAFGRVWLDRFMIGYEHQRKGYGRASLKVLINTLYDEYNYDEIYLSIYDNNKNAIKLYEDTGFYFNGELDINGEKVMVKKIR